MSEIDFSDITRDDIKKAFEKYDELKETNQLNNPNNSIRFKIESPKWL